MYNIIIQIVCCCTKVGGGRRVQWHVAGVRARGYCGYCKINKRTRLMLQRFNLFCSRSLLFNKVIVRVVAGVYT